MKILVTGANGFLASFLIPILLEEKDVFVCGVYRNKTDRLIQDMPRNLVYERSDLSDTPNVSKLFKKYNFDAIIHTAGSISKRNDYNYLQQSIRDNMVSQENLVNEALRYKCKRYIFCSSISAYGDSAKSGSGFSEDDLPEPRNVYGWSKYTAEELLRVKTRSQTVMKGIVLRFAGIHGVGRQSGVIYTIINSALHEERLAINEPKSRFRFLFADDAAQAIMLALFSKQMTPYRCYNVAGEETVTLDELARQIFKITGRSNRISYNKEGSSRSQVLNIDKIKRDLKFRPRTLTENLKSMVGEMKGEKAYAFGRTCNE